MCPVVLSGGASKPWPCPGRCPPKGCGAESGLRWRCLGSLTVHPCGDTGLAGLTQLQSMLGQSQDRQVTWGGGSGFEVEDRKVLARCGLGWARVGCEGSPVK